MYLIIVVMKIFSANIILFPKILFTFFELSKKYFCLINSLYFNTTIALPLLSVTSLVLQKSLFNKNILFLNHKYNNNIWNTIITKQSKLSKQQHITSSFFKKVFKSKNLILYLVKNDIQFFQKRSTIQINTSYNNNISYYYNKMNVLTKEKEILSKNIFDNNNEKEVFIDIGVNLSDLMFKGIYHGKSKHQCDINTILKRAKLGGVEKIIITGGSYEESKNALELCEKYDPDCTYLYMTVGLHPTRGNEMDSGVTTLEKLSSLIENNKRVVAIGEMGLDFDRLRFCDKETQCRTFVSQLQLVKKYKLPMFLHMRESCSKFIEILENNREEWKDVKGIVHSFTDNAENLQKLLSLGLHISVNGCSLKNDENIRVVKLIPIDKLHFETDSPWCSLKPSHSSFSFLKSPLPKAIKAEKLNSKNMISLENQKKNNDENYQIKDRNEPVNICYVAQVVYSIIQPNMSFQFFCQKIFLNSKNFFSLYKKV